MGLELKTLAEVKSQMLNQLSYSDAPVMLVLMVLGESQGMFWGEHLESI